MSRKTVLLGPYPPPYGGVSIYIRTLHEFFKDRGVEFWIFGDEELKVDFCFMKASAGVLRSRRRGAKTTIADCTHFLIEIRGPGPSVALKEGCSFEWIKSYKMIAPFKAQEFNPLGKALFRLACNRSRNSS